MIFLLDSTAFSDLMRKNPQVEERLAAILHRAYLRVLSRTLHRPEYPLATVR